MTQGTATSSRPTPGLPGGAGRRSWLPFTMVWLPSVIAIIGSGACLFCLSWWLSQSSHGSAGLGLVVGVSSVISLSVVALSSGRLDRADRRRAVTGLLLALAIPVAALIPLLGAEYSLVTMAAAAACYVAVSTLESLYLAVNETTTIDLAPPHWPSSRTALLTQIHSQVERVVAPSAAGALLAAGHRATVPAIALALVIAMAATVATARRHLDAVSARAHADIEAAEQNAGEQAASGDDAAPRAAAPGVWQNARIAFGLMRSHRDLVFLIQLGILGNLVVFPFYAVLPAFLNAYVDGPAAVALWYARSATAYGLGMLLGSMLLARFGKGLGRNSLGTASLCLGVICLLFCAVTAAAQPLAVVVVMAVVGALFSVMVAVGGAVWLERTPSHIRARVFSLRRLTVYSSIPLGTALMGLGGAAFGSRRFVQVVVVTVVVLLSLAYARFRLTLREGTSR